MNSYYTTSFGAVALAIPSTETYLHIHTYTYYIYRPLIEANTAVYLLILNKCIIAKLILIKLNLLQLKLEFLFQFTTRWIEQTG